jgi:uncharacterized protein (DUF58 family)
MRNRRNALYVIIILSLLAGLFTGRAFFFNLAYVFAALLILSFVWAWLSVRWLGISRRTRARRAQVGRNLEESFSVTNWAFLPKLWLEIRDHSDLPGHRASHVVPSLMGRQQYHWEVTTPCLVRGEFRLGPMTLMSGDPFGLFVTPRRLGATSRVIVFPATVPLTRFEMPTGVLTGGEAQRKRSSFVTTNVSGIRDYVPGDSINRIHWKSSAKRGSLMVREFEIDPLVDVWLLIDFSAASLVEDPGLQRIGRTGPVIPTNQQIPPSTEEYAVVIAASIASYLLEQDRAMGFIAYTPHREVHEPERGSRQLSRILQTLAVARSFSPYTLAQMLSLEAAFLSRGTTLVIVTSSLEQSWVAEAQILSRKGIHPMAVLVDAQSFGGYESPDNLRAMLRSSRIPSLLVRRSDDISTALAQRPL